MLLLLGIRHPNPDTSIYIAPVWALRPVHSEMAAMGQLLLVAVHGILWSLDARP